MLFLILLRERQIISQSISNIVAASKRVCHRFLGGRKGKPHIKRYRSALGGVPQWIECQPANQKVTSLIPNQGTCLGFRPGPQLGACERQLIYVSLAHQCFSPCLSPSLSLTLKINK